MSSGWTVKASQAARVAWLAFTLPAVGLSVAGIRPYLALLMTPCDGPGCLRGQLSSPTVAAWLARGESLRFYGLSHLVVTLAVSTLLLAVASFLIWRRADNSAAVVAAFVASAVATGALSQALAQSEPRAFLPSQLIRAVQVAGLLPLALLFPDGRFQGPRQRGAALAYLLGGLLLWGSPAATPALWLAFGLSALAIAGASLLRRLRAATDEEGRAMRWAIAGLALTVTLVILDGPPWPLGPLAPDAAGPGLDPFARTLGGLLLATGAVGCLLVALVLGQPMEADLAVNRAVVYGALTALVLALYGLVVGYLGGLMRSDDRWASLAATGIVAVAFQPLREWVQRRVNRMMYGQQDEPYALLRRLTTELDEARLRIVTERAEARRRLGADLHDDVGHRLVALARQVERARSALPPDSREPLAEVSRQLAAVTTQVRGLAHEQFPPDLDVLGLAGALRERAAACPRPRVVVDAPDALPRLPAAVEVAAYHVALEALANAAKHAEARECRLRLRLAPTAAPGAGGTLELDIVDDGRGVGPAAGSGLGLLSMRARAAELGGTCAIEAAAGGGTAVRLRIPIAEVLG